MNAEDRPKRPPQEDPKRASRGVERAKPQRGGKDSPRSTRDGGPSTRSPRDEGAARDSSGRRDERSAASASSQGASASSSRPARRDEGSRRDRSTTPDRSKERSRSTAGRWRRDELPQEARTAVQAEYDGPPIPEDITGQEIDRAVGNQLKSLPEKLALRVARHLVAAARLMDSDPETAYRHTLAARARAARVAIVREACGEAGYAAGRFKEALTEFKAARRMSGNAMYLPMMADCERALKRPERAVAMAKDPSVDDLDEAGRIEMRIVEAGARRDLGDVAAALRLLDGRDLRSRSREAWVPRLRYAYADTLLADGQQEAAHEWFERAAGIDSEGYTDAAERVAELEGLVVVDTVDDSLDDS